MGLDVLGRFRGKALRYMAASLVGTVVTQILLVVFISSLGWALAPANFVAVCLTVLPSYYINRYWVWGKRGSHSWAKEVVPFWAMAIAGLFLSTLLAGLADVWTDAAWAGNAANISGFGLLWVVKFVVIDEYVFAAEEPASI
jgi:putative flippase GtrA